MAYKINIDSVKKSTMVPTAQLGNLAYGAALSRFNKNKKSLLEDFDDHDVTQEILAGPTLEESKFVGKGNLFAFIGFTEGSTPVQNLRALLEKIITVKKKPSNTKASGNIFSFSFDVNLPTQAEIAEASPMPERWSNDSWVKRLEKGISGLRNFIFDSKGLKGSFSGTGLQVENKTRPAAFRGVKYLSEIFDRFKDKLD